MADYAMLTLTRMALDPGVVHNAVDLAAQTGLPPPTTSKVLARLGRYGLLESTRGNKGGYRLARTAAEISVEDIVAAIDGPVALTLCQEHTAGPCEFEQNCASRPNLARVNQAVRRALSEVRLADLMPAPFLPFGVEGGPRPAARQP